MFTFDVWGLAKFIFTPLITIIVIVWFCVGWALPRIWISGEQLLWRGFLGNSTASQIIIDYIKTDFYLTIRQKEIDDASPRPLAVLQAIWIRLKEILLTGATKEWTDIKNGKLENILESAINNLNDGWRRGIPHDLLERYIKIIEDSANDDSLEPELRMKALCSIAVVKYALGNVPEGLKLGKRNWEEALQIKQDAKRLVFMWMAAYGYNYATLFSGHFGKATDLMAEIWIEHYLKRDKTIRENLIKELNNKLILNTILSIPRHMILAATFKEPKFEEKYFPSEASYLKYLSNKTENKIETEIEWVTAWLTEAENICQKEFDEEGISRDFSYAYYGFYLSLLLQDVDDDPQLTLTLQKMIADSFDKIAESAPIPVRYAKFGFYGIYQLVCGDDKGALDSLRQAASYSTISGNRFADVLFMGCHALAAARLCKKMDVCLAPEIEYYLKETRKLARKIGGKFYPALYAAMYAAVCELRGDKGEAARFLKKSRSGDVRRRFLKMFLNDK